MRLIEDWVTPLAIVTVVYLIAFFLTFLVVFPFQEATFGSVAFYANLLFLPHGIRLLTALFYGWRSVIFLAPASLMTHYYLSGWAGFGLLNLMSAFVGISCGAMGLQILKWLSLDVRNDEKFRFNWRYLLLAGIMASILNSVGTNFFYNDFFTLDMARSTVFYLIGDISGQFFMMLILMLIFRWVRLGADLKA